MRDPFCHPTFFSLIRKGKGCTGDNTEDTFQMTRGKERTRIIKMINESLVCCYYRLCCFFSRGVKEEGMYYFLLEKL